MIHRIAVTCAFLCCFLCAATASAQPGDRHLDMKARVLGILFPLDVKSAPYFSKMILRFGDSDTQLVVVIYPGGKSELIRYSLAGVSSGKLSQLISKMVAENPDMTDWEIAARLKVDVSRSPIEPEALEHALDELKAIRISPILESRVAVDAYSEYEFWYDTWQESVRYAITGPGGDAAQVKLVQWMVKFRASARDLLKVK